MQHQLSEWPAPEAHVRSRGRPPRLLPRTDSQRTPSTLPAREFDPPRPEADESRHVILTKLWEVVEREAAPVLHPVPVLPPVVSRETPARENRVRHSYD